MKELITIDKTKFLKKLKVTGGTFSIYKEDVEKLLDQATVSNEEPKEV